MKSVDVVIVSDAKNDALRFITENAVRSLLMSETDVVFNVYIIESSNSGYSHMDQNVHMVKPSPPFGYHKYLNQGRRIGSSEYVCLCNNDLMFFPKWATNIIKAMELDPDLLSASPISCDPHIDKFEMDSDGIQYGHQIGRSLCGWCIFQKRILYDIIGDLNEEFLFYYCDNDYAMTLREKNLKHALVRNSRVDHLIGTTYRTTNQETRHLYYNVQKELYENKWPEPK